MTLSAINFSATITSTPVSMNGVLYFSATDSVHGTQLWSSSGTSSGTTILTDINPQYGGLNPSDLTLVGNTLYFVGNDGPDGPQLWASNGTISGTKMVSDVEPGIGLLPSYLTNVNGTLYFVGYNPVDGYQLYTSNGTSAGTAMVADIGGTAGCDPSDLTAVGSTVYFSATDGVHGDQLWMSNGTSSGTVMVADIDGTVGSYPDELTAVGNSIDFAGFDTVHGYQLYTSNGTPAGTVMLTSANANGGGLAPSSLTAVGNTLYFAGNDGVHGYQLYTSNGTPAGTVMLTSGNVAGGGLSPTDLTAMGSTMFFTADDGLHGSQLWSSNGTAGGTSMVVDLNGAAGSDPSDLTAVNGTLYLSAYTSQAGFQVWQSNGTSSGTTMIADVNGAAGCNPTNLMNVGSTLYFTGTGATLWQWQNSGVTPTINWPTPASIVYGTALGGTQLDATASTVSNGTTVNVPGVFTYTPAGGTVLGAGNNHALSVSFMPTDTTDYTNASGTATITVTKATPTITWANPANIVYGTALGATQLDATASWVTGGTKVNVPGTYTYGKAAGTVLGVGNSQTLSVNFTPTDTTDYASASWTATITVTKATPTITWANPANIVYGTALGATQLDANASWVTGGTKVNVPGTYTYSKAAGTVLGVGNSQTLSVSFTPTDTTDYASASGTATINVLQATPKITWSNPANIVYGTALGATQLDATASWVTNGATVSVPGVFTYTPAAGTVLALGNNQALSVSFKPTDLTDYASATATASINVLSKVTPTITWSNPANIVYGTTLGGTQLDAAASCVSGGITVNVPGVFAYAPVSGTMLGAGNNQALSVSFTPTDTTDYANASGTAAINVGKATPTITWSNPGNIVYGTALGGTQLDATASCVTGGTSVNIPGTFTYTPASGTVMLAGNNQPLSVSFTPTDTTDYAATSATATINVVKATPTISWSNPANIVYGTALSGTQLDATASWVTGGTSVNVPGTFTYTPAAGTVMLEGNNQPLSVSFTPTDTTDYAATSATATINVVKATPTISWSNPANIVYGTALSGTQLDAAASWVTGGSAVNIPGTFTYTPASGTVMLAGNNQPLSVSFTPTDTTDYAATSATATINVVKATPTISWSNPGNIVYGTALGGTQLDATASWVTGGTAVNVPGTFTYTPASGTLMLAGNNQPLSVSFTPTDTTDYAATSATATINVVKATPTISWSNPGNIVYGTALGGTQLDATASWVTGGTAVNVPGTFTYTPASGTVLLAGNNQSLSVSFTPTDTTDYAAASATATINVVKATPTISWSNPANVVYGTALSGTQLDATASWVTGGTAVNVPGTFTYTPASGTVMLAGNNQPLSVSFIPTDTTDYAAASATGTINVVKATPTSTWANPANIVSGTALGGPSWMRRHRG